MVQLCLACYVTEKKTNLFYLVQVNSSDVIHLLVIINALLVLNPLPEERHSFPLQRMRPMRCLSVVIDVVLPSVPKRVVD